MAIIDGNVDISCYYFIGIGTTSIEVADACVINLSCHIAIDGLHIGTEEIVYIATITPEQCITRCRCTTITSCHIALFDFTTTHIHRR